MPDPPDSTRQPADPLSGPALAAELYETLRAGARVQLARERPGHTLQPTALVHEAFLRLAAEDRSRWSGPAEFYAAAAEAMRRILVEHARARGRLKRGGGRRREPLTAASAAMLADDGNLDAIMALDEAVRRMSLQDERLATIIRLRVYAGLSVEDTAGTLGISARTVKREWAFARAWLAGEIGADGDRERRGDGGA